MRGFFTGGGRQPRPRICPSCGSLVGINSSRCHECGTNLTFSMAAVTRSLSGVFSGPSPATTTLLIANLFMFAVEWMATAGQGVGSGLNLLWGMNGAAMYRLGASFGPAIFGGHEWYRLITAQFLHGGLLHIGFNMMALMQLGPALEELYGSARYLFLYIVCGAVGFLLSAITGHFSLGASGAILGIVGAILAITYKRGGSYMQQLRSRLVSSVVILFAIGFFPGIAIDNMAHLGGLAAGFLLGKIFPDRQPVNSSERQLAHSLGWIAFFAIVASFVLMVLHYRNPLPGQA